MAPCLAPAPAFGSRSPLPRQTTCDGRMNGGMSVEAMQLCVDLEYLSFGQPGSQSPDEVGYCRPAVGMDPHASYALRRTTRPRSHQPGRLESTADPRSRSPRAR